MDRYFKRVLMPIGEYVPFQDYLPQKTSWFELPKKTLAGWQDRPIVLPDGTPVGILVCYEDTVAEVARRSVFLGAEFLVGLADLRAFKDPVTLDGHFRLAKFRSIENRRYLVCCTSNGFSANVDPWGRVVASLPAHTEGGMTVTVKRSDHMTVYTSYGDWVYLFCVTISLIYIACRLIFRRRHVATAPLVDPQPVTDP
jgi:apolipoprotein N-acyltransferase